MIDYFVKQNDTLAVLEAALTNCDGEALDLTLATVAFQMRSAVPGASTPLELDATVEVLPVVPPAPVPNRVRVSWAPGDLASAGRYYADWQVTWGADSVLTLPTVGHMQIHVSGEIA